MDALSSEYILRAIDELVDLIKTKSIDWWWLDQGDYPITKITIFDVKENEVTRAKSPKISLRVAISKLKDNLSKARDMDLDNRLEVLSSTLNDFHRIFKITERITFVHKVLDEKTDLLKRLSGIPEAKSLLEELNEVIEEVKINLDASEEDWKKILDKLQYIINSITEIAEVSQVKDTIKETEKQQKKIKVTREIEEKREILMEEA